MSAMTLTPKRLREYAARCISVEIDLTTGVLHRHYASRFKYTDDVDISDPARLKAFIVRANLRNVRVCDEDNPAGDLWDDAATLL